MFYSTDNAFTLINLFIHDTYLVVIYYLFILFTMFIIFDEFKRHIHFELNQ